MMLGDCSLSCSLYVVLYPIIKVRAYLKYEKVNKIKWKVSNLQLFRLVHGITTCVFACVCRWEVIVPFDDNGAIVDHHCFIGVGNRRTRRKQKTSRKSLTKFITCCTPSPDRVSNSQTSVVIGTDCIGSCKSNYHTSMTTTGRNITIQWEASEQKD
jgi:hypothetical protein